MILLMYEVRSSLSTRSWSSELDQTQTTSPPGETSPLQRWLNWIEAAPHASRTRSWYHVVNVARRLDLLCPAPQVAVIAGTNGKGTTLFFAEQLLLDQGLKVGSTYSPHLHRYNERIRINGQDVSDEEIVSAFEAIHRVQDNVRLSYHDYATLASLWLFKQYRVDVALLEVGVGGRYDATNVVRRDVNVITSIGLDHQDMLGRDLATIGWEKAGISRVQIPLIYGDLKPIPAVLSRARVLHCPLVQRGINFDFQKSDREKSVITIRSGSGIRTYDFPRGSKLPLSLGLAIQILETMGYIVSAPTLANICAEQLPGRMEVIPHLDRSWLLDVAHNPDAIRYLNRGISKLTDKNISRVLLGVSRHKDFPGIIKALDVPSDRILVTATLGRRGTTWKRQSSEFGIQCIEDLDCAYQELVAKTVSGEWILVVGSFDVVGRLRTKIAS